MAKVKKIKGLDLSLLVYVDRAPLFTDISDLLWENLKHLPQTRSRLLTTLKFAWYISSDIPARDDEHKEIYRAGFFRAALAEYASVEETLGRDVASIGIPKPPLLIRDIQHPLPHLLKEMRNLEIHLISSAISAEDVDGVLYFGEEEHRHVVTCYTVADFDLAKFQLCRNAAFYDLAEIDQAIRWFNEVQSRIGITQTIRLGVEVIAEALAYHYAPT